MHNYQSESIAVGAGLAEPQVVHQGTNAPRSPSRSPSGPQQRSGAVGRRSKQRSKFGFHVLDTSRNRRRTTTSWLTMSEDDQTTRRQRDMLVENARDCDRNCAVAAWAVRKHLDFVASFNFQCRSKDRGLRRDIEAYITERSRKENFDADRRHPLRRWIRLAEARKVLDGDIFGIRIGDGSMQAMESETCRDPARPPKQFDVEDNWNNGVYCVGNVPTAYAFHRQTNRTSWTLERVVNADHVVHHADYSRFRQARGYSTIISGLATLIDTYECIDYATAKAKVDQIWGLALYRDALDSLGPIVSQQSGEDGDETASPQYDIDLNKGPMVLDLQPGDKAEILSSSSPSDQVRSFIKDLIQISLAAIDVPMAMWDSQTGNFFGNRIAVMLYIKSANEKRQDLRDLLHDWSDWQLERAFTEGDLLRPSAAVPYHWHATGVPWWNPSQEINAFVKAIENRLTTRSRVVQETLGCDWWDLNEEWEAEDARINGRPNDGGETVDDETVDAVA